MSESHSHTPLQPPVSLAEDGTPAKPDANHGAPKVYKSADNSIVKKGPPVAPKPAWFRQSLRGLRPRGLDPRQRPAVPTPAPRDLPGPHDRASIRQKISSFETFGSPQPPLPRAPRPSLQPPSPAAEATQPPGKQEGGAPGPPERGAPLTAEQPGTQPEQPPPGSHTATEAGDQCAPGTPPRAQVHSGRALTPDPLPRLLPVQTAESPGTTVKAPSQRAHSFPLTRTRSLEVQPADARTCKLYSISSQLSSAVMQSLLCLPSALCRQPPCSPREGAPATPSPRQDPAAGSTDTSFSLNLSELREYTEGLGEPPEPEDGAPAAGQSVISLLSPEELKKFLEEVKVLDAATLKQLDSIHVTVLHKAEGAGLGFSLAGGADLESKAVTVHRVFPSGLASQEGTIQKGYEVLSINGKSLKGATHSEALAVLRQARDPRQAVVVTRRPEAAPELDASTDSAALAASVASDASADSTEAAVCTVILEKTSAGLGFSLEGGKGSLLGDKPLTVNRIFKGAASGQTETLRPGDEILHLAGTAVQGLSRFEAWSVIKALPDGPVSVLIRRSPRPQGATAGSP